ncbi:MAG: glycosyltransferase family 2 protein, partial [Flavobacterium sp.]
MISIIIPIFNRPQTILETVFSILQQDYQHWECLIVDDCSNDGLTYAAISSLAEQDLRINIFQRPDDLLKGPNSCRNYGFEKSKGTFIYFLDSDDVLLPNALSNYLNAFNNDIDVVVAPLIKSDAKSGDFIKTNNIQSEQLIEDYFTGAVSFYVCGPMWRRTFLIQQSELFDPEIRNLDDWDFNLRMLYVQPRLVYLKEPTVNYRQHPHSLKREISKNNLVEIKSAYRARLKHLQIISRLFPEDYSRYCIHVTLFYQKTLLHSLINGYHWKSYYYEAIRL